MSESLTESVPRVATGTSPYRLARTYGRTDGLTKRPITVAIFLTHRTAHAHTTNFNEPEEWIPVARSSERAYAEAVTALTARLESWGVADPVVKATEYVNDMLREGWRPKGPRVEDLTAPVEGVRAPDEFRAARAALKTGGGGR